MALQHFREKLFLSNNFSWSRTTVMFAPGEVVPKLLGLAYESNTPALSTTISGLDCMVDRLIQHGLYCAELTATLSVLAGRQAGTPGMLDSAETWETSVKSTA